MNPITNKKDLETTIDDIRNYAYAYLEKYSPSKQQLKTYLHKKIVKKGHKISLPVITTLRIATENCHIDPRCFIIRISNSHTRMQSGRFAEIAPFEPFLEGFNGKSTGGHYAYQGNSS